MTAHSPGKKTIFLDRDGTIIIDKIYLNDPDQIEYLPGTFEALQQLRDAGFQFVIATNQSGIARRLVTMENLDEIHRRIRDEFSRHGIDLIGFYYAPYSVESNHPMRKPNPGMILRGALDHAADLSKSWMIGDRLTDVIAGHRAGCKTILLTATNGPVPLELPPTDDSEQSRESQPTFVVPSLLEAAQLILRSTSAST